LHSKQQWTADLYGHKNMTFEKQEKHIWKKYLCVKQNNESHTSLEQHNGE